MKFFRFNTGILLLASGVILACKSEYKLLNPVFVNNECIEKIKPQSIATAWYSASVDVAGRHMSGLLLVKEMPDQSRRVVFTNEAGVSFFDFEFSAHGEFTVKKIISQLDKKPVIETLRKDFHLLLGYPFQNKTYQSWSDGNEIFYGVRQNQETAYFITDQDCAVLKRTELGSKRKRKVSIIFEGADFHKPSTITLKHHTFNMVINLKKLDRGNE